MIDPATKIIFERVQVSCTGPASRRINPRLFRLCKCLLVCAADMEASRRLERLRNLAADRLEEGRHVDASLGESPSGVGDLKRLEPVQSTHTCLRMKICRKKNIEM